VKNTCLALSLLIFLSPIVCAQERAPLLLVRAVQCLAVKQFLPSSKATALSFGYLVDEESYPGEKVLYLINYANPARSDGLVFAIFLTQQRNRQVFNIQNNASFVLSRINFDFDGVSFVDPPLGGDWTQGHLASAIRRIEKQPRFIIPVKDLLTVTPLTDCESYTDH
jgi:hypothetical protein